MKKLLLAVVALLALSPWSFGQSPAVQAATADLVAQVRALEARVAALEAHPAPQMITIAESGPAVLGSKPTVLTLKPPLPQAIVVPPGMHAHVTIDGRTIIHGNENLGDPVAHAGIARPWIRTAEAGQVAYGAGSVATRSRTVSVTNSFAGDCPGGNCPAPGRPGFMPFGGFFRR